MAWTPVQKKIKTDYLIIRSDLRLLLFLLIVSRMVNITTFLCIHISIRRLLRKQVVVMLVSLVQENDQIVTIV